MRLALAGLPSAGKSTLFRALAGRRLSAGKARDDAGQALVPVPDPRLDILAEMYKPQKTVYAQVTYLDPPAPAGKVDDPAASLAPELRQAEGLIQVVRNFDGGLGAPTPAADYRALADEMLLGDLIMVERRLERIGEEKRKGRKIDETEAELMAQAHSHLSAEKPLRTIPEVGRDPRVRGFGLLTAKPLIVVANNEEDDPKPPDLGAEDPPVVVRAAIEAELAELSEEERAEFMADLGIAESALDRLLQASYQALELITFFTVGSDECRAWTIRQGTLAPQAAGVIHSDMERGFIRAEVIRYEDLIEHGSEAAIKKAGLMKLAGKDHLVSDGEIFHVRFNV